MQGTVKACLELGYTKEQAELIGKIDDDCEEAVKLDLISEVDALAFGQLFARISGKQTGKVK